MLPGLLHIRSLLDSSILQFKQSLHATPTLHETLTSLRSHLADLLAKMYMAMQVTSFSTVYSFISRWFMKVGKLCIEVLDWLLLPRMVWTVTVRHAFALLVLYAVKVFVQIAVIPIGRSMVRFARPFFINREYLQQEKLLQQRLDNANDYLDWKKSANELDRLQGRYHWKESSQSPYYDWRRIRDDLQRFRQLVDAGDVRGIMAFSRSRLLRNLVGINDRRLYSRLRAGTKRLIEEYVSEVVRALQLVCVIETPLTCSEYEKCVGGILHDAAPSHVSTAEKLSFFNETRHAFGRSALLLSGGATLGLYHIGVCKALHDNKLLPRVLSGSSVGSIICAMVGTRTDEELEDVFATESNSIKLNFFPPNGGSVKRKIARLFSQGVLMDIKILKKCVKANVPALTFQEAYELSGRIINIVVSPASGSGNQDSLRLLNYLTAPNVLVWSAALASCAIPGVYAPVELMKKDEKTGKLVPYMEGNMPIKWEDGSVQADLPMQRLSELFNINHFIVSQCNPHVIPFVSSASSTHTLQQSFLSSPLSKTIDYLSSQLKTTALNFLNMNMMPIHPSVKYILDQKYLGDVTLVPDVSPGDYTKLLVNPTAERLRECIIISERSTWRLIPVIRGACEIEFALDECVRRMRGTLILEELNDARMKHQQQAMSRVRSWSSDLLAVGNKHKQPLHEEEYDEDEEEGETTGPSPPAAKVHSLYNLAEPERYRLQTEPDRYRLQPGEKNANVKRSSTVMGLAEDGEQPVQPLSKRFDHQPEADDILSDDEEIEQQPKAVKPSNQAEGEGEVPCIDDEGIPRSKPVLSAVSSANNIAEATPQASVQTIDINSNVMNGVTPTFNSSPEKTPLTAASTSSEPMPQRPQVSPILLQPSPNNPHVTANHTAPLPPLSAINSALRTNKPRLNPPSKRVNIDERAPGWIPPAVPLSVLTKDGVSGESLSVPPVITSIQELSPRPAEGPSSYEPPIKVPTRSPSGSLSQLNAERKFKRRSSLEGNMATSSSAAALASPRTSDVTTHLSAEEWDEEKNAGRLTQLLRTTQSKLSVSGSPLQQKKKRVNLHSATPVDVSVHIPSLVTFRPTGPRRMSALDLQMLDQADDDPNSSSSAPVPNIKVLPPPAGLMQRAATEPKQEYEPSDDDDDDLEHRRPPSQPMDAQEGTLGRWLNRASSFFRRDSDASSAAGLNQSHNATPQPTSPRSYSSSSSNSGATSPVQAETPAVPCSPSQRKKISASSSSSTSKPAILRAASQGLPRALSQLELISDVGTMP